MIWGNLEKKQEIVKIMQSLVLDQVGITLKLGKRQSIYTSRFIGIHLRESSSAQSHDDPMLIIERLAPEPGNVLIQSTPKVSLHFFFDKNFFRFKSQYRGISNTYPSYGFLLNFPRCLEFRERRSEDRSVFERPDLISAEFTLGGEGSKGKRYSLRVHNYSKHGVGLVIAEKDMELVDTLKIGERINCIAFYTSEAIITNISGSVRHITRIKGGEYQGYYIMGIESKDIIPINETIDAIL